MPEDRTVEQVVKVKPVQMRFDELMLKIRNGQIRIPNFQREFVWERAEIIKLLDSVYHHFPVGSLLFWHTDEEIQSYRRIGEIELRHDRGQAVQYVLDGQQRLTSLFAALEQAEITHLVNGKTVTKQVQIYFDLDSGQFVNDPFSGDHEKVVVKIVGLPQITSTDDYLRVLVELLQFIRSNHSTSDNIVEWLISKIKVGRSRARHLKSIFQSMDLFVEKNDLCTPTAAGLELAEKRDARPVVRGLVNAIQYFDALLPKLVQDGEGTEDGIAQVLAEKSGEDVKRYKVRCRLKWLAGLGLGEFRQRKLILSPEGKSTIDAVLREIEIRKSDLQEDEKDKHRRYFSVRQITNMETIVEVSAELGKDKKRLAALGKVIKRFNNYPFSVIDVYDQPIEIACEIFERINNSGKVLELVDLMVAKSWSESFNMRERLAAFREELKKGHYDDLPNITILQCVSGVIQKSVQRKEILGIEKGKIEENWGGVLESMRRALDFLRSNLHITHAKVLPYNAIVVPLTYFFHISNTKQHTDAVRNTLERWFWKASVSNRYESTVETKIGDDIAEMDKLAKGQTPSFNYVSPLLSAERIVDQKLNLGSAFCKTILCVLNYRGPKEFKDSSPVLLTSFSKFNALELHHIFPQDFLKKHDKEHYSDRDSMANIALVRAFANKEYLNKPPSRYLPICGNPQLGEVLQSHFIDDEDASGILEDDFEDFVQYRAERILDEMRRLTGNMAEVEADFKGNEAKTIEKFELRIRALLDTTLRETNVDYWRTTGTPEFRQAIEERIADWLKTNPLRTRSEAREVDFCQILDYLKVAKAHWNVFEPIFKSRSDLDVHLMNVNNFRKALMHSREIDFTTRQLALGSLSWFDDVFKAGSASRI